MSTFVPELWAGQVAKRLRESSIFAPADLDPRDVWNGENPGTYEEAVAWARLMNIRVAKRSIHGDPQEFIIHRYNGSRPAFALPVCSPAELIEHLRKYASTEDPHG